MIILRTAPWSCSHNFRNILLLKMCEQFKSLKGPNDTPNRKVKRKSVKIMHCIVSAFPTYTPIKCFFQTCTMFSHKGTCFRFCFVLLIIFPVISWFPGLISTCLIERLPRQVPCWLSLLYSILLLKAYLILNKCYSVKQIEARPYNIHLKLMHNKHKLLPISSHEITHKNAPQLHFYCIVYKTLLHALWKLTL